MSTILQLVPFSVHRKISYCLLRFSYKKQLPIGSVNVMNTHTQQPNSSKLSGLLALLSAVFPSLAEGGLYDIIDRAHYRGQLLWFSATFNREWEWPRRLYFIHG